MEFVIIIIKIIKTRSIPFHCSLKRFIRRLFFFSFLVWAEAISLDENRLNRWYFQTPNNYLFNNITALNSIWWKKARDHYSIQFGAMNLCNHVHAINLVLDKTEHRLLLLVLNSRNGTDVSTTETFNPPSIHPNSLETHFWSLDSCFERNRFLCFPFFFSLNWNECERSWWSIQPNVSHVIQSNNISFFRI